MTRRIAILTVLLTLAVLICAMPFAAMAEAAPPTALAASEHFGVSHLLNPPGNSLKYIFEK